MHIEDVLQTSETMRRLISLDRQEMPGAVGIAVFDYHPLPRILRPSRREYRPKRRLKMPRLEIQLLFLRLLQQFLYSYLQLYLYIPNSFNNKIRVSFCFLNALLFWFFPLKITTVTFDEFRECPLIFEPEFLVFQEQFLILLTLRKFSNVWVSILRPYSRLGLGLACQVLSQSI